MKKVLILGHNGMLGNCVYLYLKTFFDVEIIESFRWKSDNFIDSINNSNSEFVVNCIGAIPQKKSTHYDYDLLNYELPLFLGSLNKKIIFPSTDCVFSGNLTYPNKYNKNSYMDAYDEYGKSKIKISIELEKNIINTKTIRTSIIGHELNTNYSLLNWFLQHTKESVNGYNNYYWNGITTLEWSKICKNIILNWNESNKIIQIGTETIVSKYELLNIINDVYKKENVLINVDFEKNINRCLESDFNVKNIKEQLIELKKFYNYE